MLSFSKFHKNFVMTTFLYKINNIISKVFRRFILLYYTTKGAPKLRQKTPQNLNVKNVYLHVVN